jgi:hypothetical protein
MTDDSALPLGWFLAAPLGGLVVMVVVHTMICRRRGERRFLGGVATAFTCGFATFLLWQGWLLISTIMQVDTLVLAGAVNIPLFICLAYCYYNFVNLGHASIRIRIYAECREQGGHVSEHHLAGVYSDELLKEARLCRLLEGGDMICRGECYHPGGARLVPVAWFVFGMKKLVLGRSSEFDHLS